MRLINRGFLFWLLTALLLVAGCQKVAETETAVFPSGSAGEIVGSPTPLAMATPAPGALFVDAGQTKGTISPLLFGANHGPWAGIPFDLRTAAANAGITFLRFPGGNWGDQQTWRLTEDILAEKTADTPHSGETVVTLPPQSMTLFIIEQN